jgi:hypothetical protein
VPLLCDCRNCDAMVAASLPLRPADEWNLR